VTVAGSGSRISSLSTATGPDAGAGGRVSITAEALTVADGGRIAASTVDGPGGALMAALGQLNVNGAGEISTATSGVGDAGDITVGGLAMAGEPGALADAVLITDGGRISASSVAAATALAPQAEAGALRLGNAGSIFINTVDLGLYRGGSIQTLATTSAGGSVTISAMGNAFIDGSSITASAQGLQSQDSGGNITIGTPRFLVVNSGEIRADANAGPGGNISLGADTFLASADSLISATSATNVDGAVTIDSVNDLTGTVVEVEVPGLGGLPALASQCSPQQIESRSSLVVRASRPVNRLAGSTGLQARPVAATAMTLPCADPR